MLRKSLAYCFLSATIVIFSLSGCGGRVFKSTPIAHVDTTGTMTRSDYIVLDKVDGTSKLDYYVFGIYQVIDDEHIKLFWIPLNFDDTYAFTQPPSGLLDRFFSWAKTEDRAYYKALSQTPDADSVISKAYIKERRGIPWIFEKEIVTFTGKAIRIKTDKELETEK